MSCCDIYNHSFYKDIHNISGAMDTGDFNKLTRLKSLFKPFDPKTSGIWQPAIILSGSSSIDYVDIFRRSEPFDTFLDPCNCSSISEEELPFEEQVLDCEYCNKTPPFNNSLIWSITDGLTGKSASVTSTNCKGANDVRMYPDDYLTKLPVLNNVYLTGLYDFKNLDQFPAVSNYNLGWDQFISIPVLSNIFSSFDGSSAKLCVDWNICEKIGEIPPNDVDSYHKTIDDHEKSYNRHLNTTKTCGNFILLQPNAAYDNKTIYPAYPQLDNSIGKINNQQLTENQLPKPEFFTKPYGFKNQDFYNIFSSGNTKLGANWKWNYSSGIVCWYRYESIDIPPEKDKRVFPGIDMYIPEGDIFFATNNGPENPTTDSGQGVKNCPSGIKLISTDKTVSGVIPGDSQFVYISENLYNKAYSMFYKLDELENKLKLDPTLRKTPRAKLELACILATSPNYDEITVDLLQKNPKEQIYLRNVYNQIDLFNTDMLTKTTDRSSNNLNIIKNKQDLFNTLVNKYGSYLWAPENSTTTISIRQPQIPNLSLDLDFQPVVNKKSIIKNTKASGQNDCNQNTISKEYYYDQTFTIGNNKLSTSKDQGFVNRACDGNGNLKPIGSATTASVFHSNSLVKSYAYNSGSINYDNIYLRPVSYDLALDIIGETLCSGLYICNKSLAVKYNNEENTLGTVLEYKEGRFPDDSVKLNRGYPASFFNPNINLCGFHQDGGVYFDSNTFGTNLVFNKSVGTSTAKSKLSFEFKTKDVGIKIYSLSVENLRNKQNPNCKTFPLDQPCKCFPLKHINNYKYSCDGALTYTNIGKILFTPNLSTHNSPDIKTYGSFDNQEIISQYGNTITIPNHGNYGETLPVLSRKIDPLNPYECSKSISVQLPSYNKTLWNLSLDKYLTDKHTDVWATVSETVDLFRPIIYVDPEDIIYDHVTSAIGARSSSAGGGLGTLFGGFNYDPFSERDREQDSITEEEQTEIYEPTVNANYRRYVNEVKINGKSFYNRQTKILFDASSSAGSLSIEIKNPFLVALLNSTAGGAGESILYTPLPCSLDGTPYNPASPTGNNRWLTNVNIAFHQQPRKQILMYQMHPLKSMGSLKPGFFHPNSGLQTTFKRETSLVFNKDKCYYDFDYERDLFQENKQYSASGSMYYANLTKKDQAALDIVSSLASHKKLRLYIRSGSTWYEYLNPHIFGFYNKHNKNLYPGAAAYFEYTNYDKPKVLLDHTTPSSPTDTRKKIVITKPSPLIPASAKINIPFNYIVPSKILHPEKITYPQFLDNFYPNIPNSFIRGFFDPKSMVIDSIRPYFFFEEEPDYLDIKGPIEGLPPDDQRIGFGTVVLDDKKNYWKYRQGLTNNPYSYEKLNERSYYDNNFSSLHFVFNENVITKNGIVNNSYAKIKPQDVILFDPKDKEFKTFISQKIIAKYLLAKIVDKTERKIDAENPQADRVLDKQYLKISTALVTQSCEECVLAYENGYVAFPENNFRNAITIYQQQNSLYQEYNQLLSNRKAKYITKWGDLVNYDLNNNPDLNDSIYIDSYINTLYPFKDHPNRYINLADSLVLNQMSTDLNVFYYSYNVFKGTGVPHDIKNELINYTGCTNYVQHQKYSSDVDNLYEIHTDQYENFIPLFDVVFPDKSIKNSNLYLSTTINTKSGIATTGSVFISGLRQFSITGLISYQNPPGVETITGLVPLNMFQNSIRPDKDSYMIVSLENEAVIRPILFNKSFYYPTPRVDDTYFPFLGNEFTEGQGGLGCVSFTKPTLLYSVGVDSPYFDYSSFNQISNNIKRPYFIYPIYCDDDAAPDCGGPDACKYKSAGGAVLTAEYQHLEYTPKKFKDIAGGEYEYVLSADEGLYNILHGDQTEFPYIQRFEVHPSDELFNQLSDNELGFQEFFKWTDYSVENRKIASKYSYIDNLFQTNLSKYKNISHTQLVADTDKVANEMLFRLIYGTKQHINTETIKKRSIEDSISSEEHKNAWSYLLQYTDIKTKPEKIYDLIPYDYSTQSDQSRRKIKGSISIEGVGEIGVGFSAIINGKAISFNVQEIEGTVYLNANHGGDTVFAILGYTYQKSETFFAVAVEEGVPHVPPTPPDANTSITQVGTCSAGVTDKNWSAGSYFTEMSYKKDDEDIDMVAEYKRCVPMMTEPFGCIQAGNQAYPDDSVIAIATTFPGPDCATPCNTCDSRGYIENFQPPQSCSIVSSEEKQISANGLSRGNFGVNDELGLGCPPRRYSISLTPGLRRGNWDAFVGGTPVLGPSFAPGNCNNASQPCSVYCNELNSSDKAGKVFDPIRIAAGNSTGGEPCECRIPSYGYCTAGGNSCDPCVPHAATSFSYNFENLYSKFQGNGHVIRLTKQDPIVHNGVVQEVGGCGGATVGLGGGPHISAKATERCFWIECESPKPPSYIIYKSISKTNTEYKPLCPTNLAFIEYDNNVTKVSVLGQTSNVLCFKNSIRTDCPALSVTLPNQKFSFTDSIESECSACDVEPNTIDMKLQNPAWEIVTEERIGILGTLALYGDPNTDLVGGGGQVSGPKTVCLGDFTSCCYDGCFVTEGAGNRQCGKDAPDSWGWGVVLNCHLPGSPDPSFSPCIAEPDGFGGTRIPVLVNGGGRIGFAKGSDNSTVRQRHEQHWEMLMGEIYSDQHACNNNSNLTVSDIVEGVVPGSCGTLIFTTVVFPATAFRQTLSGGEKRSVNYGVKVAYYTYQYRRPKTIEDILIGDRFLECKTQLNTSAAGSHSVFSSHNMTEQYGVKVANCQTTPLCYDKTIEICDKDNLCCKYRPPRR